MFRIKPGATKVAEIAPQRQLNRSASIRIVPQNLDQTMRKQNSISALALLLGLVVSSSAAQSSIEGHWEGVMVREGVELPVSFDSTSFVRRGLRATARAT